MLDLKNFSLSDIISHQNLSVVFQPILDNNEANILGYEALIRGPINSPLHSPIALFEEAKNRID